MSRWVNEYMGKGNRLEFVGVMGPHLIIYAFTHLHFVSCGRRSFKNEAGFERRTHSHRKSKKNIKREGPWNGIFMNSWIH